MYVVSHCPVGFTLPAARTCGLPCGQSVGLWWSSAEGLACNHIHLAARTVCRLAW